MGFFQYKLHQGDVIAAEARGFIPDAVLPKEADNCDGVTHPGLCSLPPNADSDKAFSKIMNWKSGHRVCLSFSRCAKNVVDL